MDLKNFYQIYREICLRGYSYFGRTKESELTLKNPWQYGKALPPCYEAQGRYRFLKTLSIEKSLRPKRVLEVAAGGGFNSICVAEEGIEVTINDLLPLNEEFKSFVGSENITFIQKNLFDLSVEDVGTFDLIVCCEVIEHIAHGEEFVGKINSLLAEGGQVLLTTPNGKYFRSKLPTFGQVTDFTELEEMQFKPDADGHLYLYTCEELKELLEKTGFKNLSFDLSITPFISGHALLRNLPKANFLLPIYYFADWFLKKINSEKFCTQLIVTAKK